MPPPLPVTLMSPLTVVTITFDDEPLKYTPELEPPVALLAPLPSRVMLPVPLVLIVRGALAVYEIS